MRKEVAKLIPVTYRGCGAEKVDYEPQTEPIPRKIIWNPCLDCRGSVAVNDVGIKGQTGVRVWGIRIAILVLGLVFLLNFLVEVLGVLYSGKQFIYNLSQMDYPEAYRVLQNVVQAYIHEIPSEYVRLISEETIRSELVRYLKSAEELNEVENIILNLSNRAKLGAINIFLKTSAAVFVALLIWHESWQAKIQEEADDRRPRIFT